VYIAGLSLFPSSGRGVGDIPVTLFPLAQPASAGVQAVGDITPTGTVGTGETQVYYVKINNLYSDAIVLVAGDTVAQFISKAITAINAVQGMPVTASDGTIELTLTCGWEGDTGNDIEVEVVSPVDADLTFVTTQPTGGAGTVLVSTFTAALGGSTWYTHVINCNEYTDTTILAALESANETCWGPEIYKPFTVYTGSAEAVLNTMVAAGNARKTQRTVCFITNPGSKDLPFVIASEWCREVALSEALDPAMDYSTDPKKNYAPRSMLRLTPSVESLQWNSSQRDTAVKAGISTIEVIDGVVCISDTVTTYHPTGEEPPAYQYVVDIAKIAAMLYSAALLARAFQSRPMVPDTQRVKNQNGFKPMMAKSAFWALFDAAGDACIIADVEYAKINSQFAISGVNPKRFEILAVWKVSGNVNVTSVTHKFGFYFGEA
jgi:phage tail sheath gpL-like